MNYDLTSLYICTTILYTNVVNTLQLVKVHAQVATWEQNVPTSTWRTTYLQGTMQLCKLKERESIRTILNMKKYEGLQVEQRRVSRDDGGRESCSERKGGKEPEG